MRKEEHRIERKEEEVKEEVKTKEEEVKEEIKIKEEARRLSLLRLSSSHYNSGGTWNSAKKQEFLDRHRYYCKFT